MNVAMANTIKRYMVSSSFFLLENTEGSFLKSPSYKDKTSIIIYEINWNFNRIKKMFRFLNQVLN